ncbi:hypothetical protein PS1_036530 [Malus domestica]
MIKPEYSAGHCREPEPRVTLLSRFSYKLLESFFENYGDIGPNHVIEAAVSAPAYQTLAVVDRLTRTDHWCECVHLYISWVVKVPLQTIGNDAREESPPPTEPVDLDCQILTQPEWCRC